MVWITDAREDKPSDAKTAALLAKREQLVLKVQQLGRVNSFRSAAAKRFHDEDLIALAKQIAAIDRQLGR